RLDALCSAAPAYVDTKARRLIELGRKGAAFVMFDGSAFTGECWDKSHGHSLPLTRQEHCDAYRRLSRLLHADCPSVLIELHDPIVAGVNTRYTPTYFLHGEPGDFDELWGYEYMWDPMDDLKSNRARSLYYVNLAYHIPIYLHINLKSDNANALLFWWYASTCRHLGIGGKNPDPKIWEAHKAAMRRYLECERFYKKGEFYGINEEIHLHVLPQDNAFVVNLFNLSDQTRTISGSIPLDQIGLDWPSGYRVSNAAGQVESGTYTVSVKMAPWSAQMAEFRLNPPPNQ
ncbi:MAG: hypothetical protein M1608_03070, partial [Candidatus Omnitrophica bacterium]|nr:hypothetical protein [Candidatus Omnitrophota bacterium]